MRCVECKSKASNGESNIKARNVKSRNELVVQFNIDKKRGRRQEMHLTFTIISLLKERYKFISERRGLFIVS